MKPKHLQIAISPNHSFSVGQHIVPNINNRWHYHEEVELIQFHRGAGTQFIGDNISRFEPGNIVLVGANLPHFWQFDQHKKETKKTSAVSTVIHFFENFLGDRFLQLPETKSIKSVLEKAKRGITVSGKDAEKIGSLIQKINSSQGITRLLALVECLEEFAASSHTRLLSSMGFNFNLSEPENERINSIYQYSIKNFGNEIYIEEVAARVGLIPNSFCRYFKSRTGKTYSRFLNELRVGHACKLLIENKTSMKQACFESGFNNETSFHKNFKTVTGMSPKKYQQEYLGSNQRLQN
jgi:AraC-like DNA-binding protein